MNNQIGQKSNCLTVHCRLEILINPRACNGFNPRAAGSQRPGEWGSEIMYGIEIIWMYLMITFYQNVTS